MFTLLCLICNWKSSDGNDDSVFLAWKCNDSKGNYTENSPYHINLLNAFSNLTSLSISQTFANLSTSTDENDNTNKVYALYDCRKDLTLTTCHHCVVDATDNILHRCPSLEAIVMYEVFFRVFQSVFFIDFFVCFQPAKVFCSITFKPKI